RIEHVCGDPNLGPEKDYAYGMRIVRTALAALQTPVTGPTLFDPMDLALEQEGAPLSRRPSAHTVAAGGMHTRFDGQSVGPEDHVWVADALSGRAPGGGQGGRLRGGATRPAHRHRGPGDCRSWRIDAHLAGAGCH